MLNIIQASSESSKMSFLIGPALMNLCNELISRVCFPYRRHKMLKRLNEDLSNAGVKHSTRCTCRGNRYPRQTATTNEQA